MLRRAARDIVRGRRRMTNQSSGWLFLLQSYAGCAPFKLVR